MAPRDRSEYYNVLFRVTFSRGVPPAPPPAAGGRTCARAPSAYVFVNNFEISAKKKNAHRRVVIIVEIKKKKKNAFRLDEVQSRDCTENIRFCTRRRSTCSYTHIRVQHEPSDDVLLSFCTGFRAFLFICFPPPVLKVKNVTFLQKSNFLICY